MKRREQKEEVSSQRKPQTIVRGGETSSWNDSSKYLLSRFAAFVISEREREPCTDTDQERERERERGTECEIVADRKRDSESKRESETERGTDRESVG